MKRIYQRNLKIDLIVLTSAAYGNAMTTKIN